MNLTTAFGGRLLILLPMAFCIFLLLASEDRLVRLMAIVVLIILEQVREWLLVNGIRSIPSTSAKPAAKDNKH